jgi:hypothetical protein
MLKHCIASLFFLIALCINDRGHAQNYWRGVNNCEDYNRASGQHYDCGVYSRGYQYNAQPRSDWLAQGGAPQPPLTSGTDNTTFRVNGQKGFLAATFGRYTVNVDNVHPPGDTFEQRVQGRSTYGPKGPVPPGTAVYLERERPFSALLEVHRYRNDKPWDEQFVRPGQDYVMVNQLYTRAGNPLLKKPFKVILDQPTAANTLPNPPKPQQHSSALPSGCTNMATCCADLERQYNAAIAGISTPPFVARPEQKKEILARAAPIEQQLQACRRQANGLPPLGAGGQPMTYQPYCRITGSC